MPAEYSQAKRQLLEKYLRARLDIPRDNRGIPRRPPGERIPLSHAQEQVWLHAQMAPHLPLYNEPVTIHYHGKLSPYELERSFNEILRRHEAWRTSFRVVDGEPVQEVREQLSITLPEIDLRGLPRRQRKPASLEIAAADARIPMDLGEVPLFRAKLIRLDDEEYRLYLTLNHIIFDGVALYRVFLPELAALYKAYSGGEPSPLPQVSTQYADYACWERHSITAESLVKDLDHWREKLTGTLPDLYLPCDRRQSLPRTFRGSMFPFKLRRHEIEQIRAFCRKEGVSIFHVLLAAFSALLQRYSGDPRIPIGTVTAGRNQPETEQLLGYFLNTVVLPADISGDPSFCELVQRARAWSLDAISHDHVPFEVLVRELKVQRDPWRNPLFQALFSLEPPLPEIDSRWRLTQMDVDTEMTKYDLYLELDERNDRLLGRFHYSTDIFERKSIARMALHWKTLLRSAVADPNQRLSELPLLTARERRRFNLMSLGPKQDCPDRCIHELFEMHAQQRPDAIAVVSQDSTITYCELNERANQVAWYLLRRGVAPDVPVALRMERGTRMLITLLGILKAGGAYLPLDPRLPNERLSFLLKDAKPAFVVSEEGLVHRDVDTGADFLEANWKVIELESKANPKHKLSPRNLAYIIYTSGSTGTPKGVAVEHHSVINLLLSMQSSLGFSQNDRLLAVTTLSFDIAGLELFLPLISGTQVVIASTQDAFDGTRLRNLLQESQATVMQATPATWRILIEAGWPGTAGLKILCGGEPLSPELARDLSSRGETIWNVYGPTETTIWSSMYRVTGHEDSIASIGRPVANTSIHIVDQHRNLVPVNVPGEIYIGGDGLARGYLNRPELTAERFVQNWLAPEQGGRLYRTGDLGRWRDNGEIEYLGRADTQVKLRGQRIELGEIESTLATHPAVREAVVALRGHAEQQKLAAYLVLQEHALKEAIPSAGELRRHLRAKLTEVMVPSEYWQIDTIPSLASGKVNRVALESIAAIALTDEQEWIGPRTETEAQLATIWRELLQLDKVDIEQNFFELGGHSLLALQMTARIRRALEVELPVRSVFNSPTIAALAEEVDRARASGLRTHAPTLRTYPAKARDVLDQLDALTTDEAKRLVETFLHET